MMVKKGFTLIELVVVVIIIGVLVSIAMPLYNNIVERSRKPEAYNTLKSILEAQKRYVLENGVYDSSSDFSGLDINITNPGKYFNFTNIAGVSNPYEVENEPIARASRLPESDSPYYIEISESSNLTES